MPITKHNYIVKDVTQLADTLRRAFTIAQSGRPGPVLVDIPKDVTALKAEYTYQKPQPILPQTEEIRDEDIEKAVCLINASKRPFVIAGGGVVLSNASEELNLFAQKIQSPVADTLMGKGAYDGTDEKYTGMVGMHGTKTSNLGVMECDLLIAVGVRFSDRVIGNAQTFARNAKVIHIDVDAAEINKNITCDCSIIGDAGVILKTLNERLQPMDHSQWLQRIYDRKAKHPLTYHKEYLTGPAVIEMIYELTGGDAILATEVGQNQMWAAQFFKYNKPRRLLTSGGLGTMGYGLGAAIGAQIAHPEKLVFNIAGDGCFRMNLNELATATRYDLPVIEVILNNHVLGMVRQWQTLFYEKRYSATILKDKVDYVKIAEAMGAMGIRVTAKEELKPALQKAISAHTTVVIDCIIDDDDKVWPMVAPGASLSDIMTEENV